MTCRIFLNYRRDVDFHPAQRIFERLETEFGRDNLFMDIEGYIKPGDDFAQKLRETIATCDVLLVVIGRGWIEARDRDGKRRLDSTSDFVRIEIVSALAQDKRVIPVLVDNATIPHQDLLPDPLKKLVGRHAVQLSNERFSVDCNRLMSQLRELLIDEEKTTNATRMTPLKAMRAGKRAPPLAFSVDVFGLI